MATAARLFQDQAPPRVSEPTEKKSADWGAFLGDFDLQSYGFVTRPIRRSLARDFRAARMLAVFFTRQNEIDRAQEELRWLLDNRHRYAGRWVALRGDTLLAAGATSHEVFNAVAGERPVPRVV